MAPAALTEKQQQIFNLLNDNKAPQEIADGLGVSKAAIYSHIRAIKDAGHPVPERYANIGVGAGRGSASKPRSAAARKRSAAAKKAAAAKAPATPTPTPTPAPAPAGLSAPLDVPVANLDPEVIVADLNTGLGKTRDEIKDRLAAIAEEKLGLESQIAALDAEAERLTVTDGTLATMQETLSGKAATNGASKTPDLTGAAS